jgi:hypothetical protein
MPVRFNRRVVSLIGCLVACAGMMIRTARFAIQLAGTSGGMLLLRGPNMDPPAQAIRAVRIRYR